jgi:multidrug efflux pump subunit AcrA (membrane-fusion protein)
MMNKKKNTGKKAAAFFVILLTAVGGIFLPSLLAEHKNGTGRIPGGPGGPGGLPGVPAAATVTVFSVRTAEAVSRDLQAYIEVNGNIVNENQVAVFPDMGGKLVSMGAALGSRVQKGEVIAQVDPSKPGSPYSLSPVIAPVAGMIVSTPPAVGATVSTTGAIVTIAGSQRLEIEAHIPEREVGQLREGLRAEVTLTAFPGEIFSATVTQVSPLVDSNSRTKKILLTFTGQDDRINAGMFARIKLNTRSYTKVITVPDEAVVEVRGLNGVYVLEGSADASGGRVRFQEVSAGVTVDGETEIRSGLEAGMTVVVQGQQFLTDGAQVRVIGRNI